MSACNFVIPFSGKANDVLSKAKAAVESQGGSFIGDESAGDFNVTVVGNLIRGSYTASGQELNITIDSKPFLYPVVR